MNIIEFLDKNPLFDLFDLEFYCIDGVWDEKALKSLHDNINRSEAESFQAA